MSSLERSARTASVNKSLKWWMYGFCKSLFAFFIVYLPLLWFQNNYRIFYDKIEGINCLPYSVFLVDLNNKEVSRDDFVAFSSMQMEPFYKNGTIVVKILSGVPGDHVFIDGNNIYVNRILWGGLLHAQEGGRLWTMGKRPKDYIRNEYIPDEKFLMLATHERSYDSRYWGYINKTQVIGRAIPLW